MGSDFPHQGRYLYHPSPVLRAHFQRLNHPPALAQQTNPPLRRRTIPHQPLHSDPHLGVHAAFHFTSRYLSQGGGARGGGQYLVRPSNLPFPTVHNSITVPCSHPGSSIALHLEDSLTYYPPKTILFIRGPGDEIPGGGVGGVSAPTIRNNDIPSPIISSAFKLPPFRFNHGRGPNPTSSRFSQIKNRISVIINPRLKAPLTTAPPPIPPPAPHSAASSSRRTAPPAAAAAPNRAPSGSPSSPAAPSTSPATGPSGPSPPPCA